MKNFWLLLSSFFILAYSFNGYADGREHENSASNFETIYAYESCINIPNTQIVYVCTGQYAYAYHSRSDCPGLGNCKGEIRYTDQYSAENRLGRVPCCRCWSNVAGRCKDDNPYYSPPTQFNPYVPQIPSVAYDPYYIAARNQREQEQAEAIATLVVLAAQGIASLITPTPEGIARREEKREIRHDKQESRRIKKAMRPYDKYKTKGNTYTAKNILESHFTVIYVVNLPGSIDNKSYGKNQIAYWADNEKEQEEKMVEIPNGVTLWTKTFTAKVKTPPYKLGIHTIQPIHVTKKGAVITSVFINSKLFKSDTTYVNEDLEVRFNLFEMPFSFD